MTNLPAPERRLATVWPAVLVLAVVVLLPFGRSAEAPIAIGAIAALVLALRRRIDWCDDSVRLVLAVFACYWIALLVSGVGAVAPDKTWSTVGTTLRFLPFALFATHALRDAAQWPRFVAAIGIVVTVWLIDAWLQMATGWSLGGPAEKERLSGIFGADNLKLGPTLATLSPFVLIAALRWRGWRGGVFAFALLTPVVLLAGSRAAWLSFALVCALLAWREARNRRQLLLAFAVAALGIAAAAAVALHGSERFGARVERSLLVFGGTESAVDDASAGRIRIWRATLKMSAAHPLNGVGARGFRYAYAQYADANDPFVDAKTGIGASHAHQIVLEVLSETGLVGIGCWLVGVWLMWRAWRRADAAARERALAPALALVAMCFPINTHLAFYSAWWGLLLWWLLALYFAALGARTATR